MQSSDPCGCQSTQDLIQHWPHRQPTLSQTCYLICLHSRCRRLFQKGPLAFVEIHPGHFFCKIWTGVFDNWRPRIQLCFWQTCLHWHREAWDASRVSPSWEWQHFSPRQCLSIHTGDQHRQVTERREAESGHHNSACGSIINPSWTSLLHQGSMGLDKLEFSELSVILLYFSFRLF